MPKRKSQRKEDGGRLKIGDAWNAITIIALSQENPLKAIAEFVENSIDARAGRVTITRGREQGEHFLMVADDKEYNVKPRDFTGQLLHNLPEAKSVERLIELLLYTEEYLR